MFGYVSVNQAELTDEAKARYRAFYCGLCKTLKARHGDMGRATLSNDMTFLLMLLSSLYEPEETATTARCVLHPIKKRGYVQNYMADYAADMNIVLSYFKCQDNWTDDHSIAGVLQAKLLTEAYRRVEGLYPQKCEWIAGCLREINDLERKNWREVDGPANLTGRMLGEIFAYREDHWAPVLRAVGEALGRFIYLMDAYEDLPADLRRKRYNPLTTYYQQEEYEAFCKDALSLMMAECTEAFEVLPLIQDVDILRNILYSGVWMKYGAIAARKAKKEPNA